MSSHNLFRLKNHALLMALAAAYPLVTYSATDARIDFVSGNVTAVDVSGVQRPLTKGVAIGSGDTIRTGDGGRAQVRFSDGALVSLQPQTEFRIDSYQYGGKPSGEEKGFFSLIKGGMRTITGLIGRNNRDAYKVTTSVATIGIRGTSYTADFNPVSEQLQAHTGDGTIEVCSGAGCILIGAGETGVVNGRNGEPKRTDTRPQLPPPPPPESVLPLFSTAETLTRVDDLKTPTSPMPTIGSATYGVVLSQTAATTGQLTSGSLTANFGSLSVSASLSGTYNGAQTFSSSYNGSISGNSISATADAFSATGSFCSGCCVSGSLSGTFYGSNAAQVGINYSLTNLSSQTASGNAQLGK